MNIPLIPKPRTGSKPEQVNLFLTPGRRIIRVCLPVEGKYQKDAVAERAWGFSTELLREFNNGELVMLLSAEHSAPLWVRGESPWKPGAVQDIIREEYGKEMSGMEKNTRKDLMVKGFMVIALAVTLLIVIVVIANLIQGGDLKVQT
ncbi:MAG: hypothetical protein PHV74_12470 [Dehalococcoidia bacterium]|nr:hypothetical protein [Dehalococcoidia bacterium]